MADPQTTNLGLYQPTRGSDSGTWDLPVNSNTGATDSLFGNVANIGLTSVPVTLTLPPNSGASWNGPYQSQSALLNLTGAITASCAITVPRAGYFIVWNQCTSGSSGFLAGATAGSFFVQLTTGSGNVIGVPPGKKCHVFSDGTNMDFVNMPDAGTRLDLHGVTAMPSWMTACTVLPYLIRDGSIYNNTAYPALASVLQNAFGGTPGLNFAVPDSRARADVAFDTGSTGRLVGTSGVTGTVMGSAGGNENLQQHNHTANVSDPGHFHQVPSTINATAGQQVTILGGAGRTNTTVVTTGITVTIVNAGTGTSQNVQPTIVSYLPLIKT